jgi:uncharacterized protein (TIGR03083 family)
MLVLEGPVGDPAVPLLRQRRRLGALLSSLTDEQWAAPSRCAGWSTQDVISHLTTTNQFWAFSIASGRAGRPTQILATFDPVRSPAELVDAARGPADADVLAAFLESTEQLAAAIDGLDDDDWAVVAEAPPGHVALAAVVHHALWDSWVHERDIVIPLGLPCVVEADEVRDCLRYGVALGPMFLAAGGSERTGAFVVEATDPDVTIVVELGPTVRVHDGPAPAGAPCVRGSAVDLLEAFSTRADIPHGWSDDDVWMLRGLDEVFDRT